MHHDELAIPGSLMNVKQKFHHNHAGKDVKVAPYNPVQTSKCHWATEIVSQLRVLLKGNFCHSICISLKWKCLQKDFYATFDLIDSTARTSIVALALSLLEDRGPITSYADFKGLVQQLIASFQTWDKFRPSGLRSCPNLASSEAATLHESPEVEPILDLANLFKRVRREGDDEEDDDVEGDEEGDDMEEEIPEDGEESNLLNNEPGRVVEDDDDEYLEYVKGLISCKWPAWNIL